MKLDQQQITKTLDGTSNTVISKLLLIPAQDELNKLWTIQAYQPFDYQFIKLNIHLIAGATVQATSNEIGQIFGENGSIARFVKSILI